VCWTKRIERGGPPLTVETEVKGSSKSTNEKGPSLVNSLGLSCRYKRFLSCLGCSGRLNTKYVFPHRTLFQFICPHHPASYVGSSAGSPVSNYVSLVLGVTMHLVNGMKYRGVLYAALSNIVST
jgi:hypothetical protein